MLADIREFLKTPLRTLWTKVSRINTVFLRENTSGPIEVENHDLPL